MLSKRGEATKTSYANEMDDLDRGRMDRANRVSGDDCLGTGEDGHGMAAGAGWAEQARGRASQRGSRIE